MKTIRTTLSCLLLIALPAVAQTGQPNVEKQVFGSSQRNIGTPAKNTAAPAADKKAGKAPWTYQRKLSERESAKQMFDRFTYGDSLYSVKLRDAANSGNRWAAFYYGYLAETGKLSGAKDYELARRSYQKAVKNTDGSLTANHLAAYNIGLMYYYGKGSSQNPAEALKWFLIAIQAYRESKGNNAVFWPAEYHVGRIKEAAAKKRTGSIGRSAVALRQCGQNARSGFALPLRPADCAGESSGSPILLHSCGRPLAQWSHGRIGTLLRQR